MDFKLMKDFMDYLTECKVPGNSIVIYHKHKEVYRYSAGYSDLENKIKMQGDELLNIYSCSKVATVTAALQLYEKGAFLLDDPLYDFLPEYRNMNIKYDNGDVIKAKSPITIRQLFTHTAGFTYDFNSPSIIELKNKTGGKVSAVQLAKAISNEPLIYEPGTKWSYSLAHDVLAAVVEVISGTRFSEYAKKNIFEPIGAKVYYYPDETVKGRMAQQYLYRTDEEMSDIVSAQICSGKKTGYFENVGTDLKYGEGLEFDSGGAGIITSISDYAIFADSLANGGKARNGEQILSKAAVELMSTNQLNDECMKNFNWSQLKGYGYGLGVRTLIDRAKSGSLGPVGEFGWGGAAGATLLADNENGFSYFYAHHMLNPQEEYYQPRLRNVFYACMGR